MTFSILPLTVRFDFGSDPEDDCFFEDFFAPAFFFVGTGEIPPTPLRQAPLELFQ
ncbi:MAG: hypothetical protein JO091_04490 [Acidobacteriaceae bacterium]|nr:hypothetical protein [Acidobacteriaceae bacterium]